MSVRRRGKSWMVHIEYTDASDKVHVHRKSDTRWNKEDAKAYESEVTRRMRDGKCRCQQRAREPVPTLSAFAPKFLETYAVTNNKPSEVAAKRTIVRTRLEPALGTIALDQIDAQPIEELKARMLREGLKPKTVNNTLCVLRRMLVIARKWKLIETLPDIERLKEERPEFDFLTFEEAPRLLEASLAEPQWHAMILTGLDAGLRLGELRALRWSDVDLVARRIMVRKSAWKTTIGMPKGRRTRDIDMTSRLHACLSSRRRRAFRGEQVFTNEGVMLTKEECKHPLWRACRKAGLREIGWHVLRHTFASHLVMRGAVLKSVQELLGHTTIQMTERYSHLSPDARHTAIKLLESDSTLAAQTHKSEAK